MTTTQLIAVGIAYLIAAVILLWSLVVEHRSQKAWQELRRAMEEHGKR